MHRVRRAIVVTMLAAGLLGGSMAVTPAQATECYPGKCTGACKLSLEDGKIIECYA